MKPHGILALGVASLLFLGNLEAHEKTDKPKEEVKSGTCSKALSKLNLASLFSKLLRSRSELAEMGRQHLFNGYKAPASTRMEQYIKTMHNSRPADPDEHVISEEHVKDLLELIDTTDEGIFDRRPEVVKVVYGKEPDQVTLFDCYIKLEEILSRKHQQFLQDENAQIVDRRILKGWRSVKKGVLWFGVGVLASLGATIGNLAFKSGTYGVEASVQQISFKTFAALSSSGSNQVQMSSEDRKKLGKSLDDLYKAYYSLYTWPEHEVADRVSFFEFKMISLISILEQIKDPTMREQSLRMVWNWKYLFIDVFNSPIGANATQTFDSLFTKYDPDGSLRSKFESEIKAHPPVVGGIGKSSGKISDLAPSP